jgi:hypothetical protein
VGDQIEHKNQATSSVSYVRPLRLLIREHGIVNNLEPYLALYSLAEAQG